MAVRVVTGDIGAGKSTAAKLLALRLGCECLDADKAAKSLWDSEAVKAEAVRRWGAGILDSSGKIIMPKIAEYIFSSRTEHEFCNGLIHPLVMGELLERVKNVEEAVIEIPLLAEAGRPGWIDEAVYVTAGFGVRAERCRLQRGWSVEELRRRESFLLPQSERMSMCEYIIHNDGDIINLREQVNKLFEN